MKPVQFTIDEDLLRRMDKDPEVKRMGRSAFLRRAISDYLRRKRSREIREAYRSGYGQKPPGEDEFGPFEGPTWPDE